MGDRGLRALVANCGPTLRDVRIQNGNPTGTTTWMPPRYPTLTDAYDSPHGLGTGDAADLGIMALLEGYVDATRARGRKKGHVRAHTAPLLDVVRR